MSSTTLTYELLTGERTLRQAARLARERSEHVGGVRLGVHLAEDLCDGAVGADHERRPEDAREGLAVEVKFAPDAVGVGDGVADWVDGVGMGTPLPPGLNSTST